MAVCQVSKGISDHSCQYAVHPSPVRSTHEESVGITSVLFVPAKGSLQLRGTVPSLMPHTLSLVIKAPGGEFDTGRPLGLRRNHPFDSLVPR